MGANSTSMRSKPTGSEPTAGFDNPGGVAETEPLLYETRGGKATFWQNQNSHRGNAKRFIRILLTLWLGAFLLFTLFSLLFMFVYGHIPWTLLFLTAVTALVFLASFVYILLQPLQPPQRVEKAIPTSLRKGMYVVNFIAILLGALVGEGIYDIYMMDYLDYDLRRHYTNVSPDESAAAHADAAVLVFADGIRPHSRFYTGYNLAGTTYCVAPIMDTDSESTSTQETTKEIQYWATGKDCCQSGSFTCGDVNAIDAHAGLVIGERTAPLEMMRGILMEDSLRNFQEAAKMSMGKFDLVSADKALFLEFVKDIPAARGRRYWVAWRAWIYSDLLALLGSFMSTSLILLVNMDFVSKDVHAAKSEMLKLIHPNFH